jgi:hypothetical protein
MGRYATNRIPDGKLHACENCGKLHYAGGFGKEGTSGRFCRMRCSKQFASAQRYKNVSKEETSRRVTAGLLGRKYPNRKPRHSKPMSAEGRANIKKASLAMWAKKKLEAVNAVTSGA